VANVSVTGIQAGSWGPNEVVEVSWPTPNVPAATYVAVVTVKDLYGKAAGIFYEAADVDAGKVVVKINTHDISKFNTNIFGPVYLSIRIADQTTLLNLYKPTSTDIGLHALTKTIKSTDTDAICGTNATFATFPLRRIINQNHEVVSTSFVPDKSTAIVFVHGYQGANIQQGGDNLDRNYAHCATWFEIFKAYSQRAEWRELRDSTDVFSFRYDSDLRIYGNGRLLKDILITLHDSFDYEQIILVAHSMGGVVSVEARRQLDLFLTPLNQPNPVKGIVTLATPFRGVYFKCNTKGPTTEPARPGQEDCWSAKGLLPAIRGFNAGSNLAGMLDLTTYYSNDLLNRPALPNPYLANLWDTTPEIFDDVYSIYGSNIEPGFENRIWGDSVRNYYNVAEDYRHFGWGANDGLVPVASAIGATSLSSSQPYGGFKATVVVPRDHSSILGCPTCQEAKRNNGYDPQLNKLVTGIKSFLLDLNVPIWVKQFGTNNYDDAFAITTDNDGNQYVVGHTNGTFPNNTNSGGYDAYIAKYSSSGTQVRVKQFGTSSHDAAYGITTDSADNLYVTGFTSGTLPNNISSGGDDIFIAKYASDGSQVWIKQFGTSHHEIAYSITTDSAGNLYITGETGGTFSDNTNSGSYDVFIAKYASNGNQVWVKQFGTSGNDIAYNITIDTSDNLYITGHTPGSLPNNTSMGSVDAYIAKYTINGNQVWVKQFGTSGYDEARGITADSSDNLYVAGTTNGTFPNNANIGNADAYIAKYDSSGVQVWIKQFGTSNYDDALNITTSSDGDLYVTGSDNDIFITEFTTTGSQQWIKQFGTSAYERGSGISIDSSGNLYVTGGTGGAFPDNTNLGLTDAFIAKLLPD
jgi:pimeloyl-ACP methyl ester carboxylesterase